MRVLIITTSFAPENAVGSVRLVKFVKYLVRLGFEITVISPTLHSDTPRDDALECDELEKVSRVTVSQSNLFQKLLAGRRKKLLASRSGAQLISSDGERGRSGMLRVILVRLFHFAYTMIRNWDWKRQVIRLLRADYSGRKFRTVISSYPSVGAMWAASWVKNTGLADRWVADFRDPLNYEKNSTTVTRWLYSAMQRSIVEKADAVTAVSRGVGLKLDEGKERTNVHIIPNGYDPDDFLPRAASEDGKQARKKFQFAYVGSLYGGERDISVVFEAIRTTLENGLLARSQIEFVYAGNDFSSLAKQAASTDLQSILIDHGSVTRQRSLEIQNSSDMVVVATWNSEQDQGIMTGKLYECFLLRKPIIGVVGGSMANSEFKSVVDRVGAGFVFEEADASDRQVSGLRDYLAEQFDCFRRDGGAGEKYEDCVSEYAYPNLVDRLSQLIDPAEPGSNVDGP